MSKRKYYFNLHRTESYSVIQKELECSIQRMLKDNDIVVSDARTVREICDTSNYNKSVQPNELLVQALSLSNSKCLDG